jgi:hypothetical protein
MTHKTLAALQAEADRYVARLAKLGCLDAGWVVTLNTQALAAGGFTVRASHPNRNRKSDLSRDRVAWLVFDHLAKHVGLSG